MRARVFSMRPQVSKPSASKELSAEVATMKLRIQIENDLYFEYEVSPHRAILARRSEVEANELRGEIISRQASTAIPSLNSDDEAQLDRSKREAGLYIPFKQVRLKGQINPLAASGCASNDVPGVCRWASQPT